MLRNLHVKNLALIEEAEVDFAQGLNILTGETGAGKSIIIGSINLALGEKIPKEMLRDNGDNAFVELIFEVQNAVTQAKLQEMEVFLEDGEVILSRRIVNGRSIAKINGESVPASKMKEVSSLLIDIHGQHEHQSLLKKHKHLEILDDYAKEELESVKEEIKKLYQEFLECRREIKEASLDDESRMRELSLLEYEIHEIEEAAVTEGEDEALEERYKKLSNGRKILEALYSAHNLLSEQTGNISELSGRVLRELDQVERYDDNLKSMAEEASQIDSLMNDLSREISDYIDRESFDEAEFVQTENRLNELNHLKSKYGHSITEVLAALADKEKQADKLRDFDAYRKKLTQKLEDITKQLSTQCELATSIRVKYAKELTRKVKQHLIELNFLDVAFEMDFKKLAEFSAEGSDDVEFLISTNPGEPLKPLGKVASGGELSRIMLALKTVLAENDEIGCLIFDEIDTGISGRTAQMVSEKMNVIAGEHQVICITHLPQIAAMADAHFLIEKEVLNQTTISTIKQLTQEESIFELARMLGGVKITDTVLESAKEMRELAQTTKK